MKFMCGRHVLAVGLAISGWAGGAAGQGASAEAWSRVPAVPTTYYSDDDFVDRVEKMHDAVIADISRQTEINTELKAKFEAMDAAEKMRRLQAFMTKNPQEAMKFMQATQAAGNAVNTSVSSANENALRLQKELAKHKANFNAALDAALKPLQMRQEELIETRTQPAGEAGSEFKTAADLAQYSSLVRQENAEYEKIAASYFAPKGAFTNWLADYKEHVAKEMIAAQEAADGAITAQLSIMDTPTGGYRSIATLEAVRGYLEKLADMYKMRRHKKVVDNSLSRGHS